MIDIGDFLTSRKGRNGMAEDFVALMQAIAPEMAEAMARRAMVLTAIAESAPVGRRQLALRLNLAEREVRADVEKLRDAGLITLDKAGMNPTPNASRWLESARSFARQTQGLTALETALMQVLPVKTVFVAPGDADADVRVLSDVGRLAGRSAIAAFRVDAGSHGRFDHRGDGTRHAEQRSHERHGRSCTGRLRA